MSPHFCLVRFSYNVNCFEEMAAVLGDGKLSVIKRWLRAATSSRKQDAFMLALSEASWLPVGYVWDNVYLVGGGKQAERELSERRKLAVLKVLRGSV